MTIIVYILFINLTGQFSSNFEYFMTDIDVQATKHVHMYQLLYQLLVIILQS